MVVVFHGERVTGRYALFRTRGDDWMIHRMDPADPAREPMPEHIEPMKATLGKLPRDDAAYGYEIKWDGARAIAYCSGDVVLESRNLLDVTPQYPELRAIGRQLGSREAVLDGEIVALDEAGDPSFQLLQRRMHLASDSEIRRRAKQVPVTYMVFDLLYAEGRTTMELTYEERRSRLEALELEGRTGRRRPTTAARARPARREPRARPRGHRRQAARQPYLPGKRTTAWVKVKNVRSQELVIGGWLPGKGRREGEIGALLVGYYEPGDGEPRFDTPARWGPGSPTSRCAAWRS